MLSRKSQVRVNSSRFPLYLRYRVETLWPRTNPFLKAVYARRNCLRAGSLLRTRVAKAKKKEREEREKKRREEKEKEKEKEKLLSGAARV